MSKILRNFIFGFKAKTILVLGILLMISNFSLSQQRRASSSGNWNSTATWGGQSVPTTSNDVVIEAGIEVTITTNAECNSLSLQNSPSNSTTSLNINPGATLIVGSGNGLVTIGSGTSMSNRSVSTTEIIVNGNLFSGTIDQLPGVRSVGQGGSGNTNLIINSGGNVTSTGNITGSNNGTSGNFLGTARVIINSSGSLKLTGIFDTSEFTNSGSSTVEYNGGDQTIRNSPYANLILSGSGTKTLPNLNSISANLTLSGTVSATSSGNLSIGGNLNIENEATLTTGNNFSFSVSGTSQIGGGSSGQLILGGTGAKTFTGNVTVSNGATWNESGAGPITFSSDLINNGNFTSNSGLHTFSGTNRAISGSSPITISNLSITGTYTNNTTLTTSNLDGSGTLTQGTNSTLNLTGTYPITGLAATTNCPNTVNYSGANQTVRPINYCNLSLSGSGTKTLQIGTSSILGNFTISGATSTTAVTGITIGGNVLIGSGTTFFAGNFTHNVAGNWANSGTFNPGTSTINFNGTGPSSIGSSNFNNITFSGSGTKTATGALALTGNVSITNNFTAGSFTHTVGGNWTRTGTFNATGSTIDFSGANAATIGTSNFQNVTFSGSGTKTATGALTISGNASISNNFTAGAFTHTVGGNWTRTGTFNASGSTIDFTGAGAANIGASNFQDVTFSGSGTKSATGALAIAGNVSITNNFTAGAFTHTVGGNWNNAGTFSPNTSTINLNGNSASTISSSNFNNLTISGSGTKTATGNLTIMGDLSLTGILSAGAFTHTLNGNFTTSGTLNIGTSTFIFSRSGDQNISNASFFNLDLSGSGNKFFNQATTIQSNLTISGSAIARLGALNSTTNTLKLGTFDQPAGTYGSSASSATNKNSQYFGTADLGILTVSSGPPACSTGTWLGIVDSNWNNSSNWCNGIIPNSTTNVSIASTAPNQPIIGTGGGITNNLSISSGASLSIAGAQLLQVHGNWILNGTFNPGTSSTVEFKGSNNNSINSGSFAFLKFDGTGTKTINGTLLVSESVEQVGGIVVLTSPNTLTINSGKSMIIRSGGTFTTNGPSSRIIIKSQANYANYSSSNPRLEVSQVFTGAKGWRMIGTPVTSTYGAFSTGFETQGFPGSTNPSLQPNLLWWDETDKGTTLQGWRMPSQASDAFPVGRGHYFYIFNGDSKPAPATGNYSDNLPLTQTFTGTEINLSSGTFDFGVTFTPRATSLDQTETTITEVNQVDEGFNLVANPTASYLDWNASTGWAKTNMDQTIYVWDPASSSFLTWNGTLGTLGSGVIAPYQAFWVKANAPSPVLRLTGNGAKALTNQSFFGRQLQSEPTPYLRLSLMGESLTKEAFISFGLDGSESTDPKDAFQLEPLSSDWLLLYSYGSITQKTPLVINHLDPLSEKNKIIPLHVAAAKNGNPYRGNYILNWTLSEEISEDFSFILMDHISEKAIDMRKVSSHSFTFSAPKLSNARTNNSDNPFDLPKAGIFQSPFPTGEVTANARKNTDGPTRPFTIYISKQNGQEIGYLPNNPKLFTPAPNPFTSHTKIRFFLPDDDKAEITITNLMGQSVAYYPAQLYEKGIHQIEWITDAMNLPAGIYIVRLKTETFQATQKLIKN